MLLHLVLACRAQSHQSLDPCDPDPPRSHLRFVFSKPHLRQPWPHAKQQGALPSRPTTAWTLSGNGVEEGRGSRLFTSEQSFSRSTGLGLCAGWWCALTGTNPEPGSCVQRPPSQPTLPGEATAAGPPETQTQPSLWGPEGKQPACWLQWQHALMSTGGEWAAPPSLSTNAWSCNLAQRASPRGLTIKDTKQRSPDWNVASATGSPGRPQTQSQPHKAPSPRKHQAPSEA